MEKRISSLLSRFKEVEDLLGKPETLADQTLYKELTQEHAYLSQIKEAWDSYQSICKQLEENSELAQTEKDPEFQEVLREEIADLTAKEESLKSALESLLVPPDPYDSRNIVLELRAGTGGDEAALFVGDCVKMYRLFADVMGWKFELLSTTPSDVGGYKEYIMAMSGTNVYRFMKYEAGTHRVQRVPDTETQGRVHTSAITVAVLLEPEEEEKVVFDEKELKIDTYRASGAGGQHVNTTDSAVRITHIPTGAVAYCQQERSQHKNKDKAMRMLTAKIAEAKIRKQQEERSELRASMVGSGDRSERIRTYNFPQNRVSDHRIDLTLYKLDQIMEGALLLISEPLVSHFYQEQLKNENAS